jgi:hypothetical protein
MVTGLFYGSKSNRSMKLAHRHHLVPRLIACGYVSPLPYPARWEALVVFAWRSNSTISGAPTTRTTLLALQYVGLHISKMTSSRIQEAKQLQNVEHTGAHSQQHSVSTNGVSMRVHEGKITASSRMFLLLLCARGVPGSHTEPKASCLI